MPGLLRVVPENLYQGTDEQTPLTRPQLTVVPAGGIDYGGIVLEGNWGAGGFAWGSCDAFPELPIPDFPHQTSHSCRGRSRTAPIFSTN